MKLCLCLSVCVETQKGIAKKKGFFFFLITMATITGYTETAQGYQDNTNVAVAVAPKHPNPPAKTVDTQSVLKR